MNRKQLITELVAYHYAEAQNYARQSGGTEDKTVADFFWQQARRHTAFAEFLESLNGLGLMTRLLKRFSRGGQGGKVNQPVKC